MSSLRARIERLEQRHSPPGRINWDNLYCPIEDIVPDGIIDWAAFRAPQKPWSAEDCPIERAIAAVEALAPCSVAAEPVKRPKSNGT